MKSANPVQVELKPCCAQYQLKPEAEQGVCKTIEGLIEVLIETRSVCNTTIFPVLKADKLRYRLAHDLRMVNEVVKELPAEVPNPNTLLTNVPLEAKFFTVIDLCSAFFSIPLAEDSRYLFAFTYKGKQYTYTRLPQGFAWSPHMFNLMLNKDLEDLTLNSTLLQYVDDLLICSATLEECHHDSVKVLQRLAEGGHKVSKAKLQYCQTQVEYLGRVVSHGTVAISPSQLEGVSKAPCPQTVGQMMTFLGMTSYNSEWIEDYAEKVAPLRDLIKQADNATMTTPLKWTTDAMIAFETLKQNLQSAPTLTTSDYTKPFYLYIANRSDKYVSAVLMQET